MKTLLHANRRRVYVPWRWVVGLATALALGIDCASAAAPVTAAYPTHPLRLILGYPPGGASDAVARLLAQSVGGRLGQTIVIDNRPGAGGNIAAEIAAQGVEAQGGTPVEFAAYLRREIPKWTKVVRESGAKPE